MVNHFRADLRALFDRDTAAQNAWVVFNMLSTMTGLMTDSVRSDRRVDIEIHQRKPLLQRARMRRSTR